VTERLGLIVTDASPLITLGAARALSCLTMAGVPVFIPDMVYAEVTQDMARLGAEEVVEWVRAHLGQVQIVPTRVFADYQALQSINPGTVPGGGVSSPRSKCWATRSPPTKNFTRCCCSRTTTFKNGNSYARCPSA
jgi:hypothetical protein